MSKDRRLRTLVDERKTLYKYYDDHDRLLYIGIAWDELERRREHKKSDIWGVDIRRVEVAHYANRTMASAEERLRVQAERPLWNIHYNRMPGEPKRQSRRPIPLLSTFNDLLPHEQSVFMLLVLNGARELSIPASQFALATNLRSPLAECYRRLKMTAMLLKQRAWIEDFQSAPRAFKVTIFDRGNRRESYAEMLKFLVKHISQGKH